MTLLRLVTIFRIFGGDWNVVSSFGWINSAYENKASLAFSFVDHGTRSSAYFTAWMICPPILKSPNPSRASLVRHSLYKLNRIGDKQHPCLPLLPVFTIHVSLRFSHSLTLWAMYKLLICLLSRQSIPVPFRICINSVHLTRSNAFCQSMKVKKKKYFIVYNRYTIYT